MKLLRFSLCILLFTLVDASGQQVARVTPSTTIQAPLTKGVQLQGVSIQNVCAIKNGYPTSCQECLTVEAASCPDGRSVFHKFNLGDDKTIRFIADIRGELPPGAYLRWHVNGGAIIENQEEDSITVFAGPDSVTSNVEAVVEIVGMPDEAFNIPAPPAKKKEVIEKCPTISISS